MIPLDLRQQLQDGVLELRGDGKAGGGLVLAFQSLAALFATERLHVQEWPLFSSARRGANIRAFMRTSARPIRIACEVRRPLLAVLADEAAGKSVRFSEGVPSGGTFVLNTRHTPEECARHYGLSGRVFTVPGDDIGARHLHAPIGNVAVYVAMAHAIGGFAPERIAETFLATLQKRRIPDRLIARNRDALDASQDEVRGGVFDAEEARPIEVATPGPGTLPVGAQTPLRLSRDNRTSDYARSGHRLRFADPEARCTGCAHCITNCPEGIILWRPDPETALRVTGVEVSTYCKLCSECVAICPEHLFLEAPYEDAWPEEEEVS